MDKDARNEKIDIIDDAVEAYEATYGENPGHSPSEQDFEMFDEFAAIRERRALIVEWGIAGKQINFTIDKNIPMPGQGKYKELGITLVKMEIGDSLLTDINPTTIHNSAKYHSVKIAVRTENGKRRVWRTE